MPLIEFLCKYNEDTVCTTPLQCWECDIGKYYEISKETTTDSPDTLQDEQNDTMQEDGV